RIRLWARNAPRSALRVLPAEHIKSKREHRVPLSPVAVTILKGQQATIPISCSPAPAAPIFDCPCLVGESSIRLQSAATPRPLHCNRGAIQIGMLAPPLAAGGPRALTAAGMREQATQMSAGLLS